MKRVFLFSWVLILLIAMPYSLCAQSNYFRKHFVIVIDQGEIQRNPNTKKLYEDIKKLFENKQITDYNGAVLEPVDFNEYTDQISIFASGISATDYNSIWGKSKNANHDTIFKEVGKSLIHPITPDFRASNLSIGDYFDSNLKPLMNSEWKNDHLPNMRVGLNGYLYPLVMDKINTDIPAEEYIIWLVSHFNTQGSEKSINSAQLKPLLHNDTILLKDFENKSLNLSKPFYVIPTIELYKSAASLGNTNNNPRVKGFKLGLKSLQKVCLAIRQAPTMQQIKLHGKQYKISEAEIQFNHGQELKVKDFWADIIAHPNDTIRCSLMKMYKTADDGEIKTYLIRKDTLELGDMSRNDKIITHYHFSTEILNNGKTIIPMHFTSSPASYVLQESDFVPEPHAIPYWLFAAIVILILLILSSGIWWIYDRRGNRIKAEIEDLKFDSVSYERYMDVSNMKVTEYDCWYMDNTNTSPNIILTVRGKLKVIKPFFARNKFKVRLESFVKDVDNDPNFTYQPEGVADGGLRKARNEINKGEYWYRVDCAPDGTFEVAIYAYLDVKEHPQLQNINNEFWSTDHILKLDVDFRALAVPKSNPSLMDCVELSSSDQYRNIMTPQPRAHYEFIARPDISQNTDQHKSWIAFDPGTSGSCAAFTTGGNAPDDCVHLVYEKVDRSGEISFEKILRSNLWIKEDSRKLLGFPDEADVDDVGTWEEEIDFVFGEEAYRRSRPNSFQSIKKLLGYTNTLSLYREKRDKINITGKKLAQLLVKGLYNHTKEYMLERMRGAAMYAPLGNIDSLALKKFYMDDYGSFSPQRAIVAVPNNYTLPKIQAMVDTIKGIGQFKEVHYVYESEGVLMHYCHKNWNQLKNMVGKLVVVFDMGGATINATAFKISKVKLDSSGNPENIEIATIGKIGYCVGGDDIDYALIRQIYELPKIKNLYKTPDERKKHMATHKQTLIRMVRELKMQIVDKSNGRPAPILESVEAFQNFINEWAYNLHWTDDRDTQLECADDAKIWIDPKMMCSKSRFLKEYVYDKVEDSVMELNYLINKIDNSTMSNVELVFSGRSTLFPGICEKVIAKYPINVKVWDGLNNGDTLDVDAVKTAVVLGACWYAYFSTIIKIERNVITNAFGYIDYRDGDPVFVPMIDVGERFPDTLLINTKRQPLSGLSNVRFVQMLGHNYGQILKDFGDKTSGKNKHKMNILDEVVVSRKPNSIAVTLDDKYNFSYEILTSQKLTPETYLYSRLHKGAAVKTEIADENNESYMFAAISTSEESQIERDNLKQASKSKNKNNRF